MRLLDSLRFRIATLFQRSQLNADMEEELRSHIQHRADDLERSGLPRAEPERRARIEFGGHVRYKEESREAAGGTLVESLFQDLRFALRLLRKSPGFTAVAVVTLAMGIAANAVVFSVMSAFILHPLNVPQAESLYQIERGKDKAGNQSFPDYLDLRDRNRSFDDLLAFAGAGVGLDTGANPSSAWVALVTQSQTSRCRNRLLQPPAQLESKTRNSPACSLCRSRRRTLARSHPLGFRTRAVLSSPRGVA